MGELDSVIKSIDSVLELEQLKKKVIKENSVTMEKDCDVIDQRIKEIRKDTQNKAIERVACLVSKLVGTRTYRRASEDSGVAASYIAGIMEKKYLPSAKILSKLASPDAKPQNAVTLEDLMVAAGYQTELSLEEKRQKRSEKQQLIERNESMMVGIIYKELAEANMSGSTVQEVVGVRGYKPDIAIYISQQPILEWWFEIKYINIRNRENVNHKYILGQFMFVEPKYERKISLVVNSRDDFDTFVGYKDKLAYRGDLSVILVDIDTFSVVREEYLAHYSDRYCAYESEFTLIHRNY